MKHLTFEQEKGETGIVLDVFNGRHQQLGMIYQGKVGRKKKYCFFPEGETYFTQECLIQIVKKLQALEEEA